MASAQAAPTSLSSASGNTSAGVASARRIVGAAAMPTATTGYVMARAMGGDAPLIAAMTTGQHILAVLSLPFWAWLLLP